MSARLTEADLVASYDAYHSPRDRWLVGGEYERAMVYGDGRAVGYHDEHGIHWLLDRLQARLGWKAKHEGAWPIELRGEGASITLEPGGQVELSGAPFRRLADLAAEVRRNREALYACVEGLDQHWIACGLHPYAKIEEIPFVPKGRYAVMRDFLPRYGDLAHWMMKGTCCVQANFDYESEADCAEKFHVSLDLAPLNVALFANSPLAEGKETRWMSYRGHIWTRVDPRRTGFPPGVRDGYTHAGWIAYLLDCPMMFYMRDGQWAHAEGRAFRDWMDHGIDGCFPTAEDWALHQTSVFPEVRVKRTIEIRSADAVPIDLSIAFCALWTGLLYGALGDARTLATSFREAGGDVPVELRFAAAARNGLEGDYGGRRYAHWAADLCAVARRGLVTLGEDTTLLDPLDELVSTGRSPAARLLDAFRADPSPRNVLPVAAY